MATVWEVCPWLLCSDLHLHEQEVMRGAQVPHAQICILHLRLSVNNGFAPIPGRLHSLHSNGLGFCITHVVVFLHLSTAKVKLLPIGSYGLLLA